MSDAIGRSVRLFLVDGKSTGLITAENMHRACPRSQGDRPHGSPPKKKIDTNGANCGFAAPTWLAADKDSVMLNCDRTDIPIRLSIFRM